MPAAVDWWLRHGRTVSPGEARALGMTESDAWAVSNLHFDRPTRGRTAWTRQDLRELGFGARLDELIVEGRVAPDREREVA